MSPVGYHWYQIDKTTIGITNIIHKNWAVVLILKPFMKLLYSSNSFDSRIWNLGTRTSKKKKSRGTNKLQITLSTIPRQSRGISSDT